VRREVKPPGHRRFLVAPDSFKGTFSASEVAGAMAKGIRAGGQAVVDTCPVADGGEGTSEVLMRASGGRVLPATASDPLGRRLDLQAGVTMLADGETAVVETATASGLGLIPEDARDAVAASTFGTGELIAAAVRAGARKVILAVGGTATSDGGEGAIEAIENAGGMSGAGLLVLADVETPFESAAIDFGPQKGADPEQIALLTTRLLELASRLPRSPLAVPRTGAGGGIAGGLWAVYDAQLVSGSAYVLDSIGFERRLAQCDCVIVGEGRLDQQSLEGKVVGEILSRAEDAGVDCHAIVGDTELDDEASGAFVSVQTASTLAQIEAAAAGLAEEGGSGPLS